MNQGMTLAEIEAHASMPENKGRVAILVDAVGDEFATTFAGEKYRAGNVFGLDSRLTEGGVPAPRNLYLVNRVADV